MAIVVNNKGSNDYALGELVRFLHETGRTQGTQQTSVLQSDQENSIKQVRRDLSTATGLPIRHSPTYSSQSLEAVERWHKQLWALARTLKTSIYENYGHNIITTTPFFAWLVKHAAWLHNRFQLHDDGKTSYYRRWNKDYTKPLIAFGETVLFHYNDHKNNQYRTKSQWNYGGLDDAACQTRTSSLLPTRSTERGQYDDYHWKISTTENYLTILLTLRGPKRHWGARWTTK